MIVVDGVSLLARAGRIEGEGAYGDSDGRSSSKFCGGSKLG